MPRFRLRTAQDFVELVEQGAREGKVGFVAKRLKKRNCKLCMAGESWTGEQQL